MPLESVKLNASHLDSQDAFEPQRSNNAILRIYGNPDPSQGGGGGGGQSDNPDILELSLNTFPVPKRSQETVEIHWLNEVRKYAGKATYEDLTVEFNQYVDRDVADALWAWYELVQSSKGENDGRIGLARDYKKQGDVILFGPDGSNGRGYDVIGIFPSNLDPGDIDMSSSEVQQVSVTFSIDKIRYRGTDIGALGDQG